MTPFRSQQLFRPAEAAPSQKNLYLLYTAALTLPAAPTEAVLSFWGTGLGEIACNGVCVHQGPCRSRLPLLYYDEVPLRNLRAGVNRIAVKLSVPTVESVDPAQPLSGLLGILTALKTDLGSFLTDAADFRVCYMKSYRNEAPRNSGTGWSEHVTLGTAEDDWFREDAPVCGEAAVAGYAISAGAFQPRTIPLFHEEECLPTAYRVESDGAVLVEFDRMVFGRVEIAGQAAAQQLTLGYMEDLTHGWSNAEGNQEMYGDCVIPQDTEFHWKSFHKRAFRYVRLRGVRPEGLTLQVHKYAYPVQKLGEFRCSDELLNKLMAICDETLRINMDDIYNDCPHRDQSQWMDAYLSSRTALAMYGVTDLSRKCLYQHAVCSFRDGKLLSPSINGGGMLPDYAMIFLDYLLWYYSVTGDTEVLRDLQAPMRELLEFFAGYIDESGLLPTTPALGMLYLDNTFELARQKHSCALNALYYMGMTRYASLCRILGDAAEASQWQTRAAALQKTILAVFSRKPAPGLRDADNTSPLGYWMVNFSCELNKWHSAGASLEFLLKSESEQALAVDCAEYAGFRVFCNDEKIHEITRDANWSRQPNYDPVRVTLPLKKGLNRIRWEVCGNQLNFELFFRAADGRPLTFFAEEGGKPGYARMAEFDFSSGHPTGDSAPRVIRVRRWVPPTLSQSTQVYGVLSGVLPGAEAKAALQSTMTETYPRTYLSVRVPYFCEEAGEARETESWVMPVNTPWTGSYLLQTLSEAGCGAQGLSVLRRFWGGMVQMGAVNTWEEWGNRSSLCHAWGASPAWFLLSQVLGVDHRTISEGYLRIHPCLFDLQWAEGSVAVGRDGKKVTVRLKKEAGTTSVTILAPSDVRLSLDLSALENPVLTQETC